MAPSRVMASTTSTDPTILAAMNLAEAQKLLPAASPLRQHLKGLVDLDATKRGAAYDGFTEAASRSDTPVRLDRATALAHFRIGTELAFLPQPLDWNDAAHEILFPLVVQPIPELADKVPAVYPRVPDRAKCALLALLGAIGTRPAATSFMSCIREHGWPKGVYGRVFTELYNLLPYGELLFPELVQLAGRNLGNVTDVLIGGLTGGTLDVRKLDLEPLAPLVTIALAASLTRAETHQRKSGIAWRFSEKYDEPRVVAGSWLDIAGHLQSPKLTPLLKRALRLHDPRLVAFAAISLIRRGSPVPAKTLETIAACHETRTLLFVHLEALKQLARFPKAWRTWEAFAAEEMVEWLMHPSELGREPDALEHMAALTQGKHTIHVWRFREDKQPWKAGISGPFLERGPIEPQHGGSTFSRFDVWETATAEAHAAAILGTLASWAKPKVPKAPKSPRSKSKSKSKAKAKS